jgi:energy-coupling factor transporter ATP-binding protein EcfA2
MSQEEPHHDQRSIEEQSKTDHGTVEYQVLNGFEPPEHHEHIIADRYRGPVGDIAYEQLAGLDEIRIEESPNDIELSGPPEPIVHDEGNIEFVLPEQETTVPLGVWVCQRCETEITTELKNGDITKPNECVGCERQGPFEHKHGLDETDIQAGIRAGDMWHPPTGFDEGGFEALWDDVREFIYEYWDAEEGDIYHGLTAYALSTWVRPNLKFVPHLMLMGKTTGGKTRLLNTLSRVSYRGVVAASATPASMFRMIDAYNVSYYVSEYHGLGPDEQRELDNVVRAGQKRGEIVTRAEPSQTGFEPKVFDPFSHIAIATQYTPADDIVNRCIQVQSSPENREMPHAFNEQEAAAIRNRLLYARCRLLESDEWETAQTQALGELAERDITGRTREKLLSLVTAAIVWDKLDEFEPYIETVCQQDEQSVANSEDARFVEVVRDLTFDKIAATATLGDGDPYPNVAISYDDIVERYEDVNGVEKSNQWVGHIRSRLDFESTRKSSGTVIQDPELRSKLQRLCGEHNLDWESSDEIGEGDAGPKPKGSTDETPIKPEIKEHLSGYEQDQFTVDQVHSTLGHRSKKQIRDALNKIAKESKLIEQTPDGFRKL